MRATLNSWNVYVPVPPRGTKETGLGVCCGSPGAHTAVCGRGLVAEKTGLQPPRAVGGRSGGGWESGGARDPRAGGPCLLPLSAVGTSAPGLPRRGVRVQNPTPDAPVHSGPRMWCLEDEDRVRLCSASVAGLQRTKPARAEAQCPGQSRAPAPPFLPPVALGLDATVSPQRAFPPMATRCQSRPSQNRRVPGRLTPVLGRLLQAHLGTRHRAGRGCVRGRGTSGPRSWGWGADGCVPHSGSWLACCFRKPGASVSPSCAAAGTDSVGLREAPDSAEEAAP